MHGLLEPQIRWDVYFLLAGAVCLELFSYFAYLRRGRSGLPLISILLAGAAAWWADGWPIWVRILVPAVFAAVNFGLPFWALGDRSRPKPGS